MPSYSSTAVGLKRVLREAWSLTRMKMRPPSLNIDHLLREAKEFEALITRTTGKSPIGCDILEVGPGNVLVQSFYFARQNRVTAIDLDVVPQGMSPLPYLRMLKHNGPRRVAKTVIRKLLQIDARNRNYLKGKLDLRHLPTVQLVRGDVCKLPFEENRFDVVLSRSVLHHVPDPQKALREIGRVLRPGGVAVVNLHLYTSHNGSLDPRVMLDGYDQSLMWAHLRSQTKEEFFGNAILNRLRLNDWRELFTDAWPGCEIRTESSSRLGTEDAAKRLLASNDISGFTIEELTTHTVLGLWKKPYHK